MSKLNVPSTINCYQFGPLTSRFSVERDFKKWFNLEYAKYWKCPSKRKALQSEAKKSYNFERSKKKQWSTTEKRNRENLNQSNV